MNGPIYLDHQATTPVDPRVAERVYQTMVGAVGNASSAEHVFGDCAAEAVAAASREVAALVAGRAEEVVFTSGATEALNLAIAGTLRARAPRRHAVVVSPTEHPAVLETCAALAREGVAEVSFLAVDGRGRVELADLERRLQGGGALVCVMAANNEIGTLAPVSAIASMAARYGATYVCDATQAAGKVALDVAAGIDLLAVSAHKLYGPQGVGALLMSRHLQIAPLLTGGSQQRGLRPGTLNVPGIVGFGEACRLRRLEMAIDEPAIATLRDDLQARLVAALPDARVNGDPQARLAGNLHLTIPGIPNDAVIARIRHRLAISTGAACASGVPAPSHVLRAIGLPREHQEGAFRFGLGKPTTRADIERAAELFLAAVEAVRGRMSVH